MFLHEQLSKLLAAHARSVSAQIDAGACGTRADRVKANELREAYQAQLDAFEAVLPTLPNALNLTAEERSIVKRALTLLRDASYAIHPGDAPPLAAEIAALQCKL